MKIRIEIDEEAPEEIVIRIKKADERLEKLRAAAAAALGASKEIAVRKGEEECFLPYEDLLFFESSEKNVYAHTADDCFECPLRLAELESVLPRYFVRAGKSCLVNALLVRSLSRSPTGVAKASFIKGNKIAYVSRMYYKSVRDRIEDLRL